MNKKIALATLAALNAVLAATLFGRAADAHSALTYYPTTWMSNQNVHYVVDDDVPDDMKVSARVGATTWDTRAASGKSPHFIYDGVASGDNDFNPCNNANAGKIYVQEDLGATLYGPSASESILGQTNKCAQVVGGGTQDYITAFQVTFEKTAGGGAATGWYKGSDSPGPLQWDLRSISAHEFGHVTGFLGHFPASSDTCPSTFGSGTNTMCNGDPNALGTGALRSLEEHDIHTIGFAYP